MKIERLYRQILYEVIEADSRKFTQLGLSKTCSTSIGNIHHALKPLVEMNAIEVRRRSFTVVDSKKILLYWASKRKLRRDILYSTKVNLPVDEIEAMLPPGLFTAYTAYKFIYKTLPSDYGEVWIYSDAKGVKNRFPPTSGVPNLYVLKLDDHLMRFKQIPLGQLYVDLWNMDKWYAQTYLKELEAKINGILE